MAKRTAEEMEKRLAELEAGIAEEAEKSVDPQILAKAQSMVQMAIMDIKRALDTLEIAPTIEQQLAIEATLLDNKIEILSQKAERKTLGKW